MKKVLRLHIVASKKRMNQTKWVNFLTNSGYFCVWWWFSSRKSLRGVKDTVCGDKEYIYLIFHIGYTTKFIQYCSTEVIKEKPASCHVQEIGLWWICISISFSECFVTVNLNKSVWWFPIIRNTNPEYKAISNLTWYWLVRLHFNIFL